MNKTHIACSDTGSLDFFGPYLVVACYIDEADYKKFENLDFNQIVETGKYLKDHIIYSLILIDNSHYNALLDRGYKTAKIKAQTINQAIINVMTRTQNNIAVKVVSTHMSSKTYYHHLKYKTLVARNVEFSEDEETLGLKCARVLVEYARYQYMNNMAHALNIDLPLGSSKDVNNIGVELAKKHGQDILYKTCKKHMPNYHQILEAL